MAAGQERQAERTRDKPRRDRADGQRETSHQEQPAGAAEEEQPPEAGLEHGHHQEAGGHHGQVRVVAGGGEVENAGAK
jgi:hypothetical protein